jgi:hypothetical protein
MNPLKKKLPHNMNPLKKKLPHNMNPLIPNNLQRRHAVSPLKIKIPSKKSRQAALRRGI